MERPTLFILLFANCQTNQVLTNFHTICKSTLIFKMGKKCIICENTKTAFFQFPSELPIRVKWFEAVEGLCDTSKITDYTVICKTHFEAKCFNSGSKTGRLITGAVRLDNCDSKIVGERPKIANKMLCFVVHGLSTKFTIPAAYFFHESLTADNFYSLTMNVLNLLTECGFIVLRLVTDNISSNVALFKNLCNGSLKNYIDHPFLEHMPLFLSFDFCHALKNARSNVSSRSQYIRSLDSSIAPYIHISDERLHWLNETFPNYIDDIQNSSASAGMQGLTNETAHALKFTAKSTYMCIQFVLEQVGFYYVLTRSFSSDAVEATFSHVRLRGGSNDTTDARTAEYALRQILRCGIVKASKSSNTVENIDFISDAQLTSCRHTTENEEDLLLPINLRIKIQNLRTNVIPDNSIYSASVAFLARYIIKKLDDKFHCDKCLAPLLSTVIPGPLLRLIALQDHGGLIYPNTIFVGIVKQLSDIILQALPFFKFQKTCKQLFNIVIPHLQHNPIFSCLIHKNAICDIIIKSVVKPVLNNICLETTDLMKQTILDYKPTSRKILKL